MSLVATLFLAATSCAPLDEPETYDLRVYVEEHERTRIDVTRSREGVLREDPAPESGGERTFKSSTDIRLVDVYEKVGGGVDNQMIRKIVRWQSDADGAISDPEVTGLDVNFEQTNGRYRLTTGEGRRLRPDTMERLLSQAESVGAFLKLPEEVRIGETFQVDLRGLLPLLSETARPARAAFAEVKLEEVTDSIAHLSGSLHAEVVEVDGEVTLEATLDGDCSIRVDVEKHRLRSVEWKGESTLIGSSPAAEYEGEATFAARLDAVSGSAADSAWEAQPLFRDVVRRIESMGLTIELPSHWYLLSESEDEALFQTTSVAEGAEMNLELRAFPSTDPAADIEASEEIIVSEAADAKGKGATSPLGTGRSLTFSADGVEFIIDLFPLGDDRLLRVRLYGEADGMAELRTGYSKARRSLGTF